ncbi:hypothetical protein [Selenomonas ruminantium]|uniref:O-linked N-acetylglucosamine transferase, SPINDLY family protein n=1 Tax=Selenomonas ruminantium TaxID=971 RepID=UPI000410A0C8|nr:hypothetical protein [Selenomonas ruminantium]
MQQNRNECRSLEKKLAAYKAVNDMPAAAVIAKQIAELLPRNRSLWETITAVFIDGGQVEEAGKALAFMEKHFKPQPYWHVFRAQLAYLQKDYKQVLTSGQAGLAAPLPSWQKALLYNVLAIVEAELGNADKAAAYELASSRLPDNPGALLEYSTMLFYLHYLEMPQTEMFQAIKRYNDLLADIKPYVYKQPYSHKKIRVGYVSADFCYSVVAVFTYVMLTAYDKARFEVYAYAKTAEDDISRTLAENVTVWRNICSLSAQEAAALIHHDEIDILFEPSGHTANNCLEILAYKPAPIQICGVGWFDSTGMEAVDYFLTDIHVDPPGENDEYFTEKLLRLPHTHLCCFWINKSPKVSPLPFLANGYITLGTLNKFAKITDKMLRAWAAVMQLLPDARLFLKGKTFDSSLGRETAQKRMEAAGIDIRRVHWEGHSKDYLSAYEKIDIALDTFPYPGGTTTCDALFAGVPVVTLVGQTHNSRFGYSIMKNMQLEELCAYTYAEYIDICVRLATDTQRLQHYRGTLQRRMQMSPLMDGSSYMKELELLYENLAIPNKNTEISKIAQYESRGLGMLETMAPIIQKLEAYKKIHAWAELIACGEKALQDSYKANIRTQIYGCLGEAYLSLDKKKYAAAAQNYLQQAVKDKQIPYRLQYLCFLSEAADSSWDFVQRYRASREAVDMLKGNREELPDFWLLNMHNSLAHAAVDLGIYDEAEQEYLAALACVTDIDKKLNTYSAYLLICHYKPYTTAEIWQRQQVYAQMIAENITPLPALPPRKPQGKIRVGYLSPDFRRHAMFPIYYGFFACYDKERFTVIAYQLNSDSDGHTDMIRSLADEYYDIHDLSRQEAARKIRADAIDILVDLASHSSNTGLPILAYRPARVQISGLGSLCTAGISAVDYYITDEIVDPLGLHDRYFVEKPLYMPAQFSYAGADDLPASAGTPGKEKGYIQFAVVQNYRKLNDEMLLAWKEILKQVPNARLMLKSVSFYSKSLLEEAKNRLKTLGFPLERVDWEGATHDYMERYLNFDIVLDTYPYTGGSTTLDALYMGCPVVSLYGERRNTRFGYSILHSAGLAELAVDSIEAYINRAVVLAHDVELLDILHKNLRQMMWQSDALSPAKYVQRMEQAYEKMLENRPVDKIHLAAKASSQQIKQLLYLSERAGRLGDFVLRYQAAHEAVNLLEQGTENMDAALQWQVHIACADSAASMCYLKECEQEYLKASRCDVGLAEQLDTISSYLLASHYLPYSSAEIWQRQQYYVQQIGKIKPLASTVSKKMRRTKLRIGYLSPDFRRHAMFPIYYGLFACYEREQFTVVGFQLNEKSDGYTESLKERAGEWHILSGLPLEEAAQKIRAANIDILVDLASHSCGSGLPILAYRPAEIQISGLGSLCTAGFKAVDFYLTDRIVDPPGMHDEYFVEKPLYMPAQFSYVGRNDVPESLGTPAINKGYIQLASFQEYRKLNDDILQLWRIILEKLPQARLLLKSIPFESSSLRKAAAQRLKKMGFPMERVVLEAGDEHYMERYLDVDIILDTYPYTGGSTTLDALYMGCPVVSLYGERRNTRFGYSILSSLGLEELAASDKESYIERVISLAGNIELLNLLHKNLRQMMKKSDALSPVKYTRCLEAYYQELAEGHTQ